MQQQNYENHRRLVPLYHFVSSILLLAILIGSCINLFKTMGSDSGVYSASLIAALAVVLSILYYYIRDFPLKAQDRAIRAEENLRHFAMTGKLLDPKLTMRQIIGLRFASDKEFLDLCKQAVKKNMSEKEIKRAIKEWRPDLHRA
jgi:hypothetical protein